MGSKFDVDEDADGNGVCARGVVVNGIFGDVRRKESLLGDALRLGVADTRLLLRFKLLVRVVTTGPNFRLTQHLGYYELGR